MDVIKKLELFDKVMETLYQEKKRRICRLQLSSQLPQMEQFPEKGILQIFLSEFNTDGGFGLYSSEDWTIQENWKIVYYYEVDEAVTMQEVQAKVQVDWTEKEPWRIPGEPLKITFSDLEYEGMSMHDYRFESTFEQGARELYPDVDPVKITIDEIYDCCETREHRMLCLDKQEKYSGYGIANFWIRPEELERRDFSKVGAEWTTS